MSWWARLLGGKDAVPEPDVIEPVEVVPPCDASETPVAHGTVEVELSELKSRHADLLQELLLVFQRHRDLSEDEGSVSTFIDEVRKRTLGTVGSMDVVIDDVKAMQVSGDQVRTIGASIGRFAAKARLLALNANVEAARAGKAGASFSIVADEVYQLSHDIQESVASIHQVLAAIERTSVTTAAKIAQISAGVIGLNDATDEYSSIVQEKIEEIARVSSDMAQRLGAMVAAESVEVESVEMW